MPKKVKEPRALKVLLVLNICWLREYGTVVQNKQVWEFSKNTKVKKCPYGTVPIFDPVNLFLQGLQGYHFKTGQSEIFQYLRIGESSFQIYLIYQKVEVIGSPNFIVQGAERKLQPLYYYTVCIVDEI